MLFPWKCARLVLQKQDIKGAVFFSFLSKKRGASVVAFHRRVLDDMVSKSHISPMMECLGSYPFPLAMLLHQLLKHDDVMYTCI